MLRLLFDSIILRMKSFIFTVILCTVSIVLFSIAIYMQGDAGYAEKKANELIAGGVDNAGLMNVISDDRDYDKINQFRTQVYNIEGVKSVGEYPVLGPVLSSLNELHNIQSKYTDMTDYNDECAKGVFINNTSLEFCNITLESGEIIEDIDQDKDCFYIYLGYNLKEVPVGTEYTIPFAENGIKKEAKAIVKGVLSKNTEYINSEIMNDTDTLTSEDCSIEMDNNILVVTNHYSSNMFMYTINPDYNIEDVDEQIDILARDNGLKVHLAHASEIFREKKNSSRKLLKSIMQLLVISTIVSITIMICMQVMLILNNLSEYGILCANGYGIRDICKMLFLENILKTTIAYIIAMYVSAKVLLYSFSKYSDVTNVFNDIFYNYVIVRVAIISVLIAVVSSIIPIFVLRKYKVVELIGGNNT